MGASIRTEPTDRTGLVELGAPVRARRKDSLAQQLRAGLDTRLRYTAELAAFPAGKPTRAVVKAATGIQDVLGEHQDACVARERIAALLGGMGDVVDLAGYAQRQEQRG